MNATLVVSTSIIGSIIDTIWIIDDCTTTVTTGWAVHSLDHPIQLSIINNDGHLRLCLLMIAIDI